MIKITFFALIILCVVCLVLFATTTLTNGGVVYKTFATHPDTPPSGGLLLWAKTDGTFQTTNSVGTDAGMGGGGGGGAGPIVSAYNNATYADIPADTQTAITFDSTQYDTSPGGTMHSNTTNTSRLVAPSTGYYLSTCAMYMSGGAAFVVWLQLNGVATGTQVLGGTAGTTLGGGTNIRYNAMTYLPMAAGDYLECMVYLPTVDHPPNGLIGGSASFKLAKLF